jgi:ABC-type polysaccharide/polyol phosphate transport system, ATPase component
MKPIIRVENLSKQYRIGARQAPYGTLRESLVGTFRAPFNRLRRNRNASDRTIWALKDVSFEVRPGEVVGIIGRNGAGKSTLLKVLSRITEPTRGEVDLYGRVGSLLEVGTGFHPELTGRENVCLNGAILGMKRKEIRRKFEEIVAFAEVEQFIDTPVKHYSNGMYMRLAFAVAAHLEAEVLLVDEILAVGDEAFQKRCLGKMGDVAKEGRTVLFVSHNLSVIANLCTTGILLNQGKVHHKGNIIEAIDAYLRVGRSSRQVFDGEQVTSASIRQIGDKIEITAEYNANTEITMPCLGFVISDYLGNPICGTNPLIDGVPPLTVPMKSGAVKVLMEYPKLLNGTYRLSLWFGDGREQFFIKKDCLMFDVVNMLAKRQPPTASVGSVFPQCVWDFEPNIKS